MNISNNISSIQTNQTSLNSIANNIKNVTTNLEKDIPNLLVVENVHSINVSSIKVQDEIMGTLLDIKI